MPFWKLFVSVWKSAFVSSGSTSVGALFVAAGDAAADADDDVAAAVVVVAGVDGAAAAREGTMRLINGAGGWLPSNEPSCLSNGPSSDTTS